MSENVSNRQLERFPMYLTYLLSIEDKDLVYVSAPQIAQALGLNVEQVRKDLQAVSNKEGQPKQGRKITELIEDIKSFLGYDKPSDAIIVGVGHLGKAFMNFKGFASYGIDIVVGFDTDPEVYGRDINGKPIYPFSAIREVVKNTDIKIAILTVPLENAQEAADELIRIGIRGIWNFTAANIVTPDSVVVENMNLASSFAKFTYKLEELLKKEK